MEDDIYSNYRRLQSSILRVEHNRDDKESLEACTDCFLEVFEAIKMIMITKKDRYYGCFLMNFELKLDLGAWFPAAVNLDFYPFRMIINPLILGRYEIQEIIYIVCHEIEHIVLNHPAEGLRLNPGNDSNESRKLNYAMDASINDRLNLEIYNYGMKVLAEPDGAITSRRLSRDYQIHLKELQAFLYYYERIPNRPGDKEPGGNENFVISIRDKQQIVTYDDYMKIKDHIVLRLKWSESDDADEVESITKKFVAQTVEGMSETTRGNLPEHQREALEKLLEPAKLSWQQMLKRYLGSVPHGFRKTRTRLNRRQPERYDISGRISDRLIKLVIAIDTSASMTPKMLNYIFVEVFSIIGTKMCEVTIIECDAEVQRVYKAKTIKDVSWNVAGRGGTSFVPVIEYINSHREYRRAVLVYFTDGFGDSSIPRPLTYKNLWVLCDDLYCLSLSEPYGDVLSMDLEKLELEPITNKTEWNNMLSSRSEA